VATPPDLPARGDIRWALVPHAAQAPFSLEGATTGLDFATATELIRSRGPRAAAGLILPVTVRPVLLLHGWEGAHHGAYAVLRTRRIESLSPGARAALRNGPPDDLVLLDGISAGHERAAVIAGLTRVHGSAIDANVVGRVGSSTMRVVNEVLAASLELDIGDIVERRVETVLAELGIS
jgi:hypothetical protein